MTRLVLVVALLGLFAAAKLLYDRRQVAIADRSAIEHPTVPEHLRGPGRTWLVFATEFCATCGPVVDRLRRLHPDDTVHKVMVEQDPAMATAYAVHTAPTLLEVDARGEVVHSVAGAQPVLAYVDALAASA